jgi:RimJ/RimL family protein N-acetyltransferase
MQKLGMRLEGIHRKQVRDFSGNWVDLYFFGLLREEWSDRSIT